MVVISSQYSFGADTAVQISQAVFFIKGHNPNFDTKTAKSLYLSGYQILIMNSSFWFKLSENFKIALFFCTRNRIFCLEILTFKMVIKVSAWKPEVNENATLSTVNIEINDNHRLWSYNLRMPIFKRLSLIEALVISQIFGKFHEKWSPKHTF